MRLTLFTDYSLRTLMFLALRDGRPASIADVSRSYGISAHHLTKIVRRLSQLGLVQTTRGRNGGLRLGRPADEIGIGDVVRQTEEDLAIVECFGTGRCPIAGLCELQCALDDALKAFLTVLDGYTLGDLVKKRGAALALRLGLAHYS